jgi:GlpG protein
MSGVDLALFGYIWMKGMYEPESGLGMHPNSVVWMIVFLVFTIFHGIPGVPIAHGAHLVGLAVGVLAGVGPHLINSLRPGRE